MNLFNEYLKVINLITDQENLSMETYRFIETYFPDESCSCYLIKHEPKPACFTLIAPQIDGFLPSSISTDLQQTNQLSQNAGASGKRKYFFSITDKSKYENHCLFIFAFESISSPLEDLMLAWQNLCTILFHNQQNTKNEIENSYSNLISQLLHDVHSLMELNVDKNDPNWVTRYNYQKTLNKNLLFVIREFELFKTPIPLISFLDSSLELLGPENVKIKKEIPDIKTEINVDVELFSKAFNEIVKNALLAVDYDLNKISIITSIISTDSPFITKNWVSIEIHDEGIGIPADFVPYVKNAFFTTSKYNGNSGFGLTIAEKIIRAHNGYLEISSVVKEKTSVKIIIPQN